LSRSCQVAPPSSETNSALFGDSKTISYGLSGWALTSLLTIVPAGLIAWYPSRALLGLAPVSALDAAVLPLVAILFAAFALWIFTRGLHQYGRTGSSRYLDYGHRR